MSNITVQSVAAGAASALLCALGWLVLAVSAERPAASAENASGGEHHAASAGPSSAGMPVLNSWFALGSGCRARSDAPGDVSMEALPSDAAHPNVYRVRFHLNRFEAASDALGPIPPANFARECAVRLNVNPPDGQKLVRLRAVTDVVEDKGPGVKLTVREELKLGNATLGMASFIHDQGSALFHHDEPSVIEAGGAGDAMPALKCGEAKILGFDYTFLVERPVAAANATPEEAKVTLSGDKTLEFEAELAPCPSP
jgi:hypothetical protein